jgi:hypothetical protein
LLLAELRQRDIDITYVDVNLVLTGEKRRFACDISRRLSMAYDVQNVGPDLLGQS